MYEGRYKLCSSSEKSPRWRRVEHLISSPHPRNSWGLASLTPTTMLLSLVVSSSLGAPAGGTPPTFAADFYVGRQDNVAIHQGCSTPSNAPEREGGGVCEGDPMEGARGPGGESNWRTSGPRKGQALPGTCTIE